MGDLHWRRQILSPISLVSITRLVSINGPGKTIFIPGFKRSYFVLRGQTSLSYIDTPARYIRQTKILFTA